MKIFHKDTKNNILKKLLMKIFHKDTKNKLTAIKNKNIEFEKHMHDVIDSNMETIFGLKHITSNFPGSRI